VSGKYVIAVPRNQLMTVTKPIPITKAARCLDNEVDEHSVRL
jgi:hypothetical protein